MTTLVIINLNFDDDEHLTKKKQSFRGGVSDQNILYEVAVAACC